MQTIARFITKRYKLIIIFWSILAITMGVFAIRLPYILECDSFHMDGVHDDVMEMPTDSFDVPVETLFLVFEDVTDEQIEARLEQGANLELTSAIGLPLDDQSLYVEDLAYAQL